MHGLQQIIGHNLAATIYENQRYAQQARAQGKATVTRLDSVTLKPDYEVLPLVFDTVALAKAYLLGSVPAHLQREYSIESNGL